MGKPYTPANRRGPVRPHILGMLTGLDTQDYIIACGNVGAKKAGIIKNLFPLELHPEFGIEDGPVRYAEWILARLHFRTLGYRSTGTTGWRWVHPHFYEPIIPLAPMFNGVRFNNGNPRKSNLTESEILHNEGRPRSWDEAHAAKCGPEPGVGSLSFRKSDHPRKPKIPAEEIYGVENEIWNTEPTGRPRTPMQKAMTNAEIEADAELEALIGGALGEDVPSWVKAASEVEGISINTKSPTREIVLRITIPEGVEVSINGSEWVHS
jgi:hypothetical protein